MNAGGRGRAEELPAGVAAALGRGVGAFVRAAEPRRLPASIRRFHGWRQQALTPHRAALLGALDDAEFRSAVLEWLDDGKPPLSAADASVLRRAVERWPDLRAEFAGEIDEGGGRDPAPGMEKAPESEVERAVARAQRARDELRRAKEQSRAAIEAARREAIELGRSRDDLAARLAEARRQLETVRSEAAEAHADADRRVRRATRAAERSRGEIKELRAELKRARRALNRAEAEVDALRSRTAPENPQTGEGGRAPGPRREARRTPLGVPKGRLPEEPDTLDDWLGRSRWLLVDGYNVTKAEGGFPELSLEGQRDRLIDEITRLATRKQVPTTIVFDGSQVPPGTRRRRRGPVSVEYSNPDEPADDHLIALLDDGGAGPVVLVTSDRELQERAAQRGATIAESGQLLALIR